MSGLDYKEGRGDYYLREGRREASGYPAYKRCPACGAAITVTKRGRIRKHSAQTGETCKGTGTPVEPRTA